MKWWIEPAAVALGIIIVVVFVVLMLGFGLRGNQPVQATPAPAPVQTPMTEVPTEIPSTLPETPEATPVITTPEPTPPPKAYAYPATPIKDPNPYTLPYYSHNYNTRMRAFPTIFDESYVFNYQYEAVIVNVSQAPLIIDFAVSPGSSSPMRSFFLITVRDNTDGKLLAQDGYFRTYTENSPKQLIFSIPGSYHINMYGGFVTVDLNLRAPT